MLALDDPALSDPRDPRTSVIVNMLTDSVFGAAKVTAYLQAAGLRPGEYNIEIAKLTWVAAVPDAAREGHLQRLIDRVVEDDSAFGRELERRLRPLMTPRGPGNAWYRHDDPYNCGFVGPRASRAVIDRISLRRGLHDLATDQYRILVVSGVPRSGKSHSWVLIDHLRNTGQLIGKHRFVRVTTHAWSGEVTGEDLARSLAAKLGLTIELRPSRELDDARTRKLLDLIVGHYPQDDGVTRWIVLDGLDRPGVQNSARDLAKRLITLVDDNELQHTRLIVTGLDVLGLAGGYTIQVEEIPLIGNTLVRSFLGDVAEHLGCAVNSAELDACVEKVLGTGEAPRDLHHVEKAVVQLVQSWVEVPHGG